MQRSYDQIFQEMSLQNLPVTLLLDRAGLVGPDGPTHHGVFDLTFLRPMPHLSVLAPGDATDVAPMLDWVLHHDGPTAIRYAKTIAETFDRPLSPVELGKAEVLQRGTDGVLIACGSMVAPCIEAAERLGAEDHEFGVINARFIKPLDAATLLRAIKEVPWTVVVEEGMLMGGFGSAVLEAANDAGMNTSHVRRLGIPDRFIEHGTRAELLADLGLDSPGIYRFCRQLIGSVRKPSIVGRAAV